jgi:signal transduction histidine kinase/ligand-binding sensor domain-containing protein
MKLFKKPYLGNPAGVKQLRYLFLFWLQALSIIAFSQKQHTRFEHFGTASGLSESNVLCILQDSRGFMWFGTADGLNKYDGYSFTVYKNDPKNPNSLSNDFIQAITEDKNGDLWIATSGGLSRYDRRKDQFTRFQNDPGNPLSISNDEINSVSEDEKGNIWIGTSDGLDMLDPAKKQFIHYRYDKKDNTSLSNNYITKIFVDSRQGLWIGTLEGGLNFFNRRNKTFTRYQHKADNGKTIADNNITAIFEDSKQRLWIGTNEQGLDLLNKEKNEFRHFKHDPADLNSLANTSVRSIEETSENYLWIGTENGGISVFDPEKEIFDGFENDAFDNASPGSNSINSIYKDNKGNIWIGTFNAGIDLVNIDATQFAHYRKVLSKNSLSNNHVLCIYEDSRKKIWIGTDGGGLNLFDPETEKFTYFRHEKNNKNSICGNNVLSVLEDSKGNIWAGTWADGVTVFNRAKNTFKHFKNNPADSSSLSNNNAWTILEDKEKNIWIGTYGGGLNKFNPSSNSFIRYCTNKNNETSIYNNWINCLYDDGEGNIWAGTSGGGVNIFNKKTGKFSKLIMGGKKNSSGNYNVVNICEDRNKNFWIGTRSGLYFFDRKNNRFTPYTTDNGLSGNVISGILEDGNGNIWISTNKGISRFNPVNKGFKNFDMADGLQSNEFKENAYCKSSSGTMYFGGNNGFNQFFPGNIKIAVFDPPVVITGFGIFNKPIHVAANSNDPSPLKQNITETRSITLPYKSSVFSFDFASLNYTSSEKKQYAYILENFDKTWNEVGTQHTATYTNLDPGRYVFKVKGLNNEGKWSSAVTSIELTITPPYWMTWWFKLAVIAGIAGSAVAFYKFRINRIEAQKVKLEQQVHEKTRLLLQSTKEEQKARLDADQANIQLEKKNKELEEFVYIASHDLKEPLRTTSGFVDLFQKQYKGKLDKKADQYLSYITQASDRMKRLIDDLLDYSRAGNKKELEPVDCNIVLQEVLADLGIALREAGAEIKADRLPVINAYPTGIKQLFQNLITNGIKFRKKDVPPRIQISAQIKNDSWKFSFSDNGIGISGQHQEKIFIIFQRLHTRKEYEGSGIGLAHCKKIVELHNGNIWVESTPGEGSNFYFTLPAH